MFESLFSKILNQAFSEVVYSVVFLLESFYRICKTGNQIQCVYIIFYLHFFISFRNLVRSLMAYHTEFLAASILFSITITALFFFKVVLQNILGHCYWQEILSSGFISISISFSKSAFGPIFFIAIILLLACWIV